MKILYHDKAQYFQAFIGWMTQNQTDLQSPKKGLTFLGTRFECGQPSSLCRKFRPRIPVQVPIFRNKRHTHHLI